VLLRPRSGQFRLHTFDQYLGASNMSNIDKQRIAAVRKLEALGYSYQDGEWVTASAPAAAGPQSLMTTVSEVMHGALVRCADALEGCAEGSEVEAELKVIVEAIEAYEAVR
jgi:hypothetical protein